MTPTYIEPYLQHNPPFYTFVAPVHYRSTDLVGLSFTSMVDNQNAQIDINTLQLSEARLIDFVQRYNGISGTYEYDQNLEKIQRLCERASEVYAASLLLSSAYLEIQKELQAIQTRTQYRYLFLRNTLAYHGIILKDEYLSS